MLGSLLFLLFIYLVTTDGGHPRQRHYHRTPWDPKAEQEYYLWLRQWLKK